MRRALKAAFVSLFGLALVAALAGVAGYSYLDRTMYAPGSNTEPVTVLVERGSGVGGIARALNEAGVVAHPVLFEWATRLLGQDRGLQAGEYEIAARATPLDILDQMRRGEVLRRRVTVIEGDTVADVYRTLAETPGLTGELPAERPPEGSLLPETYFFTRGDTRAAVLQRMRDAMAASVEELWAARPEDTPLNDPEEFVTLASIVQKESGIVTEKPLVAAVFLNRLERGMRLQSDPTVIYGITEGEGDLGRPLYRSDWQHDSPYNTYQIDSLPPGPIANPGRAALEAVLDPADVNYLYFVADGTGGHAFATNLAEHNRNVAAWRRVRDAQQ